MITVIGLGEVGEPTFRDIALKVGKSHVCGVDINKKIVSKLKKEGYIVTQKSNCISKVYIICVSIPSEDLSGLFKVFEDNLKRSTSKILISIESTVPPLKINEIVSKLDELLGDYYLVFFPHRFFKRDNNHRVFNLNRVIAGLNNESLKEGIKFYSRFMERMLIHPVSNLTTAAICKTAENTYRYIEISFAEELKMLCDFKKINFIELREAMNTKWNINIKEARAGIKGHCLTKDSNFFNSFFSKKSKFIKTAKLVNNKYTKRII
ncbi:MAG: hypothetical protein WC307_02695 [Candidatus Nanoarchaeia archaeon]|jgi:UDP-N-acetyl-D-mannosaminuronic acid dehydrogenase